MKRRTWIILGTIVLLLIIIAGYYWANPEKAVKFIFPDVKEVEYIHVRLAGDTARIDLDLKVKNESFLKLNIDSLKYKVHFDTALIVSSGQVLDLVLRPGDIDSTGLHLKLPYMRIIKEVRRLGKDSVDLLIDLKVIYSTIFGRTALSAERKEKIEIPGLPEITVLKTEYIKREGKTFFVEATVSIKNKGSLELTIADLHYDLKAEDLFRAREKTPVKIELKPRSDTTLILPIKIEMDKLLKTAVKVLLDKDVVNYDLYVKGNIYSDKADLEGVPVEVKKAGRMELKK